jgi:hypothetical protein
MSEWLPRSAGSGAEEEEKERPLQIDVDLTPEDRQVSSPPQDLQVVVGPLHSENTTKAELVEREQSTRQEKR